MLTEMETNPSQHKRILLVEDEAGLVALFKSQLERDGHAVDAATDGVSARALITSQRYDAVLLDVLLPGTSGFQLLDDVRRDQPGVPVMYVTACGAVNDVVRGLDLGADDYLVKPFELEELSARVRALLRRGEARAGAVRLRAGDLELDLVTRKAYRLGQQVELTNREFELLRFLLENPGRPLSREEIMREVWHESRSRELMTNVVDVYVNSLRKKLNDAGEGGGRLIRTVRGQGYVVGPSTAAEAE
jgi:DNA-binding response OmpR family regulator